MRVCVSARVPEGEMDDSTFARVTPASECIRNPKVESYVGLLSAGESSSKKKLHAQAHVITPMYNAPFPDGEAEAEAAAAAAPSSK